MFPKAGQTVPEIRLDGFEGEWKEMTLGSLGSVAMNKRIFKDETSENGDIPFYKIGTFGGTADAFISKEKFKEYKEKYPYPEIGDILISASGSIGRTVVYNGEDAYYQDSNIVWLKHDQQLDNSYLQQYYEIIKWSGIEGTTIKRLYNKNILETNIFLPPSVYEQQAVGSYFSNLDNLIATHQEKISQLETLKKKLLQDMFI
jgi:type I restriction-modification system specificity subunit